MNISKEERMDKDERERILPVLEMTLAYEPEQGTDAAEFMAFAREHIRQLLSDADIADSEKAVLQQENRRVIEGAAREGNDAVEELAPALGYEYDEEYGWVTGDHTSVTLAMEARHRIGELQATLENVSEVYLEITNGNISKPGTNPTVVLDYARESNEQDHAEDLRMKDERIGELQRENERLDYMLRYIDATAVDRRLTMKANERWLRKQERGL